MRKLGLDVGEKSCGIAISDPTNNFAFGKENLFFQKENWETLVNHIKEYLKKYEINEIVVGYPKLLSGDKSWATKRVDSFIKILKKTVDVKIVKFDEYRSTKIAKFFLEKTNISKDKIKKKKDKLSAQIILEDYLYSQKKHLK